MHAPLGLAGEGGLVAIGAVVVVVAVDTAGREPAALACARALGRGALLVPGQSCSDRTTNSSPSPCISPQYSTSTVY